MSFEISLTSNQAVDGDFDTRFASGSGVTTKQWLMIDLAIKVSVCQINITGLGAAYLDRHGNLKVSFNSIDIDQICAQKCKTASISKINF